MAVRRGPPNIPQGPAPLLQIKPGGGSVSSDPLWLALLRLWSYVFDAYNGLPAPHASTHDPQSGSDPLATAAPSNATGPVASAGKADTLLRSDCTVKQGIVVAKGQIVGFSTTPAPIPVGADGQVLTADSSQALGVSYKASPGDSYARYFMLMGG